MESSHRRRAALVALAVVVGLISTCSAVVAQVDAQPGNFAQTERDRLYDELSRDVTALDRELGIYKRVVALVAPSIVHVEATPLATYHFDRDVEEAGSGVVVRIGDRDYVLTNRHVIRHSDVDHVRLELADGRQLKPLRMIEDKQTDVAVLVVDAQDLVPARIGNSDAIEIGDVVMAFGSPFNLRQSVSRGIISGKGRTNLDLDDDGVDYQNFLQTDAAINPGNSGGPLVNLRGEVIGLNTAIASNSGGNDGIGFSIPVNIVSGVMRQLVDTGHVERGFLGVTLDRYFDAQAAEIAGLPRLTGARVTKVTEQSPAALAGIESNDVILRFNGVPVQNDDHLISLVKLSDFDRQVDLVLMRDGQMVTKQARIGHMAEGADVPAAVPGGR